MSANKENILIETGIGELARAKRNIPSVLFRADQALQSIDKLIAIEDAYYIFSHD